MAHRLLRTASPVLLMALVGLLGGCGDEGGSEDEPLEGLDELVAGPCKIDFDVSDDEGQSAPTRWVQYRYDHDGRVLSEARLRGGRVETTRWEFDAEGRQTLEELMWDVEGVLRRHTTTYTPTADGGLRQVDEQDGDCPDEIGQLGNPETDEHCPMPDGEPDYRNITDFDAAGRPVRRASDLEPDGTEDSVTTLVYDEAGRLLREESDTDVDGTLDILVEQTWDAAGNLLTRSVDMDADGTPEESSSFTYDAAGNVVQEEHDSDGDGEPNLRIERTRDAQGREIRTVNRWTPDWEQHRTIEYEYDAEGNVTREATDAAGDGEFEHCKLMRYDDASRLVWFASDGDCDGDPSLTRTYHYDRGGNLLRTVATEGGRETTNVYHYDCWLPIAD